MVLFDPALSSCSLKNDGSVCENHHTLLKIALLCYALLNYSSIVDLACVCRDSETVSAALMLRQVYGPMTRCRSEVQLPSTPRKFEDHQYLSGVQYIKYGLILQFRTRSGTCA